MLLKPRLANNLGMILGGSVLSIIGLGSWRAIGGYAGFIPGVFGVMGVLWMCVGIVAIARRATLAITIDDSGIQLPAFSILQKSSQRILLAREDITAISKHDALRGRLIEIDTKGRGRVFLQIRLYCEQDEFISYCKQYGIPVA